MKRLVLVGAGHSHARVLKEFAKHSPQNVQVTLITPEADVPYSGMIPGWLAGYYGWQECCLDFERLCRRAGAALQKDEVIALDLDRQEIMTAGDGRLGYDCLSLDIGATVNAPSSDDVFVIPMRPLSRLRDLWESLQKQVRKLPAHANFKIVTVGGGAAGVESTLAIHWYLTRLAPHVRFQLTLVVAAENILPGMATSAARRLKRHFDERGITISTGFTATGIEHGRLVGNDERVFQADAVLWATHAEAYAWLRESGLTVDDKGFVLVDDTLRSLSRQNVFASGDCAGFQPPLPKAGVYAVRMGPVLAGNLFSTLTKRPLRQYVPSSRYLSLIGSGDGSAVAAWGPLSWEGAWIWRWKQRIDRRFLSHYNDGARD